MGLAGAERRRDEAIRRVFLPNNSPTVVQGENRAAGICFKKTPLNTKFSVTIVAPASAANITRVARAGIPAIVGGVKPQKRTRMPRSTIMPKARNYA